MSKKETIVIENTGKRTFSIFAEVENEKGKLTKKPYLLKAGRSISLNKKYALELLKSYPRELRDLSKVAEVSVAKDLGEAVDSYKAKIKELKTKNEKSLQAKDTEIERLKNANGVLRDQITKLKEEIAELNKEIAKLKE